MRGEMSVVEMCVCEMPFYFRSLWATYNTYVKFGAVKHSSNPYFAPEEKQCAEHICRILCPEKTIDKALVIRDDGTVWSVYLSNFQAVTQIKVVKDLDECEVLL